MVGSPRVGESVGASAIAIGVLALQGDFEAHRKALEKAGAVAMDVRTEADLSRIDGLIIPGGESTAMLKLLHIENLFEPLQQFGQTKPVFGTCAGAILLASEVLHPRQESLGLMDLTVERNGYGRQVDSRIAHLEINGKPAEAVFIRAPVIRKIGPETKVLATYLGTPVLAEQRFHLVSTFHPELSENNEIHRYFVDNVSKWKETASPVSLAKKD